MNKITFIQSPAPFGRSANGEEMIFVNLGGSNYYLAGERIHGESLTINSNCPSGKDTYPTFNSAQKALRMKSANGRRNKSIYKCQVCGCYHFTTNDGRDRRPRPYKRGNEKEYTNKQIMPVIGHSERVSAVGFSMKRFMNSMNKLTIAI